MKWLLIFVLLNGDVAELPTTQAECQRALDTAGRTGQLDLTFAFDGQKTTIPAWNVACVEYADVKEASAR